MIIVLKRYSWGLHFVTIALCSYLIAQSFSNTIASKLESIAATVEPATAQPSEEKTTSPEETLEEDYAVILQRNIFNSSASAQVSESTEMTAEQLGEMGPAIKTSLDIKLLGTLMVGEGTDRRSSATVSGGKSKEPDVFYVGDEKAFAENVKLTKVEKSRIEFLNGSRLEYAEIEDITKQKSIFASAQEVHGDQKGGPDEPKKSAEGAAEGGEGGKIILDQSTIDDALANLDRFYTEVRIVPNFKAGKVSGMKVLSIAPGSIVGKLGIRRGDVLEKINGQELDIKRGMELFNELKNQKNFTIDLVRGGQNKTLEYEIR